MPEYPNKLEHRLLQTVWVRHVGAERRSAEGGNDDDLTP